MPICLYAKCGVKEMVHELHVADLCTERSGMGHLVYVRSLDKTI